MSALGAGKVNVYFVREDLHDGEGYQPDDEMCQAYDRCLEHTSGGLLSKWITKSELTAQLDTLSKTDVVVFQEFEGKEFEATSKTKAIVIGARCLSCCLSQGTEIPDGSHPIYTVAMRGTVVTCSGFRARKKEAIETKVTRMAGKFSVNLYAATTHLICVDVRSNKYKLARNSNIKVMQPEWVDAVWQASLTQNISGFDPRFDEYKLKVFQNLLITTTGLPKKERAGIADLIKDNGGTYSGTLEGGTTDVIIMKQDAIGSDKFNCARQFGTPCVSPEWVTDSIKKGYALDFDNYKITIEKTSSPLQNKNLPDFSLNVSSIPGAVSAIRSSVEESYFVTPSRASQAVTQTTPKKSQEIKKICPTVKECAQLVDSLDMRSIKRAGPFLDNCCIYVYNFTATRREKMHRIISRCGGIRYDSPHEAVTHAISGNPDVRIPNFDKNAMPHAIFVNVVWLIDSVKAEKPLEEQPYLVENDEELDKKNSNEKMRSCPLSSPMSKKNLQLLKPPSRMVTPPPMEEEGPLEEVDEILQQYRSQNTQDETTLIDNQVPAPQNKKNDATTMTSNNGTLINKAPEDKTCDNFDVTEEPSVLVQVFNDLTFEILGMEKSITLDIANNIEASGGKVLLPKKGAMYTVVPIEYDENEITHKTASVITTLWLDDCLTREKQVPIEYFHKPAKVVPNCTPFADLTISISTYCGSERTFIDELCKLLGARTQINLCRNESVSNKACTHLICSEASGAKYNGAVKWGLPVVTSAWVIDCAAAGKRLREGPYLVGEAQEPVWEDEEEKDKTLDASQAKDVSCNKENDDKTTTPNCSSATLADLEKPSIIPKAADAIHKTCENSPAACTPKRRTLGKVSLGGNDLSPASRFIRMARLGHLESQESPKVVKENTNKNKDDLLSTPPMETALSTPYLSLFSPTSQRRLRAIRKGEMPSASPRTPKNPFDINIKTPDSGFGAILRPGDEVMSPDSRKRVYNMIDNIPEPTDACDNAETPLSEIKRRFLKRLNEESDGTPLTSRISDKNMENSGNPCAKKRLIDGESSSTSALNTPSKFKEMKDLISFMAGETSLPVSLTPSSVNRKRSTRCSPMPAEPPESNDNIIPSRFESQPETVGWEDYDEPKVYRFIISSSNITNQQELTTIIKKLGGEVIEEKVFSPSVTHMLCKKLLRTEKVLAAIASGIWLLSPDYILQSEKEGRFIDEEKYEWGNPKAIMEDPVEPLHNAAHRWRIFRTTKKIGPFNGMRFLLHAEDKKQSLEMLIKYGDGEVVDVRPPYSGDMNITFCIAEPNKTPVNAQDTEYLMSRNISLCPNITIISLMTDDPVKAPLEYAFPYYLKLLNDK